MNAKLGHELYEFVRIICLNSSEFVQFVTKKNGKAITPVYVHSLGGRCPTRKENR